MTNGTDILDAGKLIASPKTKVVEIPEKGTVRVRSLSYGEIIEIRTKAKDQPDNQTLSMIHKGLIEPKLNWEQVKSLRPEEIALISDAILELSISKEAMLEGKKRLGPMRGL